MCRVDRNTGSAASQTLQMAPLLPAGQSWANLQWYQDNNIMPEGVQYPGGVSYLRTEGNQWSGTYGRPGNAYQDSMSAISHLNDTFYNSYHTFGVDWAPGEYIRWYVDGIFAYEINPNALTARSGVMNGQSTIEFLEVINLYMLLLSTLSTTMIMCVQTLPQVLA